MSTNPPEDHRISPAGRIGIAVTFAAALLVGIALAVPAWNEAAWDAATVSTADQPRREYTRLEFARAIERAIRGK